ncbi:3-beta hydroxysteroid dehydrogenase isomerase family [Lentinula edodes]|uniref:MICOS complex subunit n=1 Tax=Lentinula edodes TaxID=5353 RepID=A0A1Q3DXK5_LENED|nr:3-beta hydroxysteroid dehydrogenase isomerase family [Lentinula edodes]
MGERRYSAEAETSPKTGRKYIVVGGAGFLGGWIVIQLLQRGEDPKNIRVLDIRLPARRDLKYGIGKDVEYLVLDQPTFGSTNNIIDAALEIGASTLIYTSSGSVGVRASRFLLWPWEKEPNNFVQNLNDDDALLPKKHTQFFSNYAYSKYLAEKRAASAQATVSSVLAGTCSVGHTSCARQIQPGYRILFPISYISSPNIPPRFPDIGGQAFTITDPGPPPTYGDVYLTLETLTNGQTFFPEISPTLMIFIAYIIEWYYLLRAFLLSFLLELSSMSSGVPNKPLSNFFSKLIQLNNFLLPSVNKDLVNLQPSLFNLTMVHLIFDDSRARMKPEQGGLGYQGRWNTAEGLWKTWDAHRKEVEMYEKEKKDGVIRQRLLKTVKFGGVGSISLGAASGIVLLSSSGPSGQTKEKLPIYPHPDPEILLQEVPSELEKQIGVARREITSRYRDAHKQVQGLVDKWINIEHAVENRVKAIISPDESLTPSVLYIGVSTLTGSILTRSRSIPLRLIFPPLLFALSSAHFLPKTTSNFTSYLGSLEDTYFPTLAQKHDVAKAHSAMTWDRAKEAVEGARRSVEGGVLSGVEKMQQVTGLKVGEVWKLGEEKQGKVVEAVKVLEENAKEAEVHVLEAAKVVEKKTEEAVSDAETKKEETKRLV